MCQLTSPLYPFLLFWPAAFCQRRMMAAPSTHHTPARGQQNMETPSRTPEPCYIIVMGMTGSGKTTFISRLTGPHTDVGVGHTLSSSQPSTKHPTHQANPLQRHNRHNELPHPLPKQPPPPLPHRHPRLRRHHPLRHLHPANHHRPTHRPAPRPPPHPRHHCPPPHHRPPPRRVRRQDVSCAATPLRA